MSGFVMFWFRDQDDIRGPYGTHTRRIGKKQLRNPGMARLLFDVELGKNHSSYLACPIVQNESSGFELEDETIRKIATELINTTYSSITIDWNLKESVRAAMRAKIRHLLARHDYPPVYEDKAVNLVIEQAELFASNEGNQL